MLVSLSIQNYALISKLEIQFNSGFSIITGETGAGKSIIVGALSLLLGQRADKSVLKNEEEKCVVEAVFNIKNYKLENFFKDNNIDYDNQTIIRREINPNGKSRAFINDSPFDLSTLKELGIKLVDIHSQHQNLNLGDHLFQLSVLDILADHKELLLKYKSEFNLYKQYQKEFTELLETSEKIKSDQEYFRFQYDQLSKANLQESELELFEIEQNELNHSEEIKNALVHSSTILLGEGVSVISMLKEIKDQLQKLESIYPKAQTLYQRIESSLLELKDIALETDNLSEKIEFDPNRLEYINERLDLIYSLQQKYKAQNIQELLTIQEDFRLKLEIIDHSEFKIEELKKKRDNQHKVAIKLAEQLSENRNKTKSELENKVIDTLKQLGIVNASFNVKLDKYEELSLQGFDRVQFLFSANKNEEGQEISKVASGGELSRFMLSLKSLISKNKEIPTILFDEIDSGVSGEIADKMATILKKMSEFMQVINITHLPQIAAKGNHHYLVYKKDDQTNTHTFIKQLSSDERIIEIAKMLSGEIVTEAALDNAKQLMQLGR